MLQNRVCSLKQVGQGRGHLRRTGRGKPCTQPARASAHAERRSHRRPSRYHGALAAAPSEVRDRSGALSLAVVVCEHVLCFPCSHRTMRFACSAGPLQTAALQGGGNHRHGLRCARRPARRPRTPTPGSLEAGSQWVAGSAHLRRHSLTSFSWRAEGARAGAGLYIHVSNVVRHLDVFIDFVPTAGNGPNARTSPGRRPTGSCLARPQPRDESTTSYLAGLT